MEILKIYIYSLVLELFGFCQNLNYFPSHNFSLAHTSKFTFILTNSNTWKNLWSCMNFTYANYLSQYDLNLNHLFKTFCIGTNQTTFIRNTQILTNFNIYLLNTNERKKCFICIYFMTSEERL